MLETQVLLEGEDLAPILQRVSRKQPEFGERIKNDTTGPDPLDIRNDGPCGLRELHLGRMEHRVVFLGVELTLRGNDFAHNDIVERPSVRCSHRAQFFVAF